MDLLTGAPLPVETPEGPPRAGWARCPSCGASTSLIDSVRPFGRATGQWWVFGVSLMALTTRLDGAPRWALMAAGLVVTVGAALRTWRQYTVLARWPR